MIAPLVLLAAAAACSDATATSAEPTGAPALANTSTFVGIQISPRGATLAPGGSTTLTRVMLAPSGAFVSLPGVEADWKSLDPSVATVSGTGVVKGVAPGTVKIVASQWGMFTDTALVTVMGRETPTTPATPGAPTAPASVATVTVTASRGRVVPNESAAFTATVKDAAGKVVTGRTVLWTSSAPTVATVGPNGEVRGASYGTATITATVDGKSGSATIAVVPGYFEPAGMRRLADRGFDGIGEDGWDDVERRFPNLRFERDPSAPRSGGAVLRAVYPVGFVAGYDPGVAQRVTKSLRHRQLYTSFWVKLSPNWKGNVSGTNKIFHYWTQGGNRVFISAEGTDANPLQFQMRLQGVPDARRRLTPTLDPSAQFVRGRWHHVEIYMKLNTPGSSDGVVQWWLDGRPAGRQSDVAMLKRNEDGVWDQVQFAATWGGGGETARVEQWMSLDHVYVSTAP